MSAARYPWAADILHFWFHGLRPDQWFGRNDVVGMALRRRSVRCPHRNAVLGRKSAPAKKRAVAAGAIW